MRTACHAAGVEKAKGRAALETRRGCDWRFASRWWPINREKVTNVRRARRRRRGERRRRRNGEAARLDRRGMETARMPTETTAGKLRWAVIAATGTRHR